MLRPLYTRRATQLLLIGAPASGKRTLASQLLRSTKIFYSTKTLEELDTQCFDRLVDIDYVLIFVDMTNPSSLTLLEETLAYMEPSFLLCKCAVVFTKVDLVNLWMLDEDQVHDIIEEFGNPYTFHVNLKDVSMRQMIAEQITRAICIGTFQYHQAHPLGVRLLNNRSFTNNIDSYFETTVHDHGQNEQNQSEQDQSMHEQSEQEQSVLGQSEQEHLDDEQLEQRQSDEEQSEQRQSDEEQLEEGQSQQEQSQDGQRKDEESEQGQSQDGQGN